MKEAVALTPVVNAFSSMSGDIVSTLNAMAPSALLIVACFMGWKMGIKFFKSIGTKG